MHSYAKHSPSMPVLKLYAHNPFIPVIMFDAHTFTTYRNTLYIHTCTQVSSTFRHTTTV